MHENRYGCGLYGNVNSKFNWKVLSSRSTVIRSSDDRDQSTFRIAANVFVAVGHKSEKIAAK